MQQQCSADAQSIDEELGNAKSLLFIPSGSGDHMVITGTSPALGAGGERAILLSGLSHSANVDQSFNSPRQSNQ